MLEEILMGIWSNTLLSLQDLNVSIHLFFICKPHLSVDECLHVRVFIMIIISIILEITILKVFDKIT